MPVADRYLFFYNEGIFAKCHPDYKIFTLSRLLVITGMCLTSLLQDDTNSFIVVDRWGVNRWGSMGRTPAKRSSAGGESPYGFPNPAYMPDAQSIHSGQFWGSQICMNFKGFGLGILCVSLHVKCYCSCRTRPTSN